MSWKIALMVVGLVGVSTIASAEEVTMSNAKAQELLNGLLSLDCFKRDEKGAVCIEHYVYDGKTMMLISRDINRVQSKLEPYNMARRQVLLSVPSGGLTKDGNVDPSLPGAKEFINKLNDMAADTIKLDLEKIPLSKLQIDSGAKNIFGSNTMAALGDLVDDSK